MKIRHSHFMAQVEDVASRGVPEPGPGYDIKTLQRIALFDMDSKVEVAKVTILNEREEIGHVFVAIERVVTSVADLVRAPGVRTVTIEFEG